MLRELSIKYFAIMDDVRLCPGPGLTVVTGETGAGKSILVNAMNLLLGGRASSKLVRSGAKTASLEALFSLDGNEPARRALEEAGLDPADELLITREVSAADRHRILINGRLATMGMLERITEGLASVSGQHAHQGLLAPERQLFLLDRFAGAEELRRELGERYNETLEAFRSLARLQEDRAGLAQKREFLSFIRDEIEAAGISPGEDEELLRKRERLRNGQMLFEAASAAEVGLYAGEDTVCGRLSMLEKALSDAARHDPELAQSARALSEARYVLEDAARELSAYARDISFDSGELAGIEERLSLLGRLKKKYGPELDQVMERLEEVRAELSELSDLAGAEKKAEAELSACRKKLVAAARALSEKRKAAAPVLAEKIARELSGLGMEKPGFSVHIRPHAAPAEQDSPFVLDGGGIERSGAEKAAFFIAPNPGEPEKPLRDIASGGELSRVVLSLLTVQAGRDAVSTMVFDEVDAGIGGAVAENVGRKLKDLSKTRQVIAITHLAQIARHADLHFCIQKGEEDGRTVSLVSELDESKRVAEIARMLSGDKESRTSLAHARELLNRNSECISPSLLGGKRANQK